MGEVVAFDHDPLAEYLKEIAQVKEETVVITNENEPVKKSHLSSILFNWIYGIKINLNKKFYEIYRQLFSLNFSKETSLEIYMNNIIRRQGSRLNFSRQSFGSYFYAKSILKFSRQLSYIPLPSLLGSITSAFVFTFIYKPDSIVSRIGLGLTFLHFLHTYKQSLNFHALDSFVLKSIEFDKYVQSKLRFIYESQFYLQSSGRASAPNLLKRFAHRLQQPISVSISLLNELHQQIQTITLSYITDLRNFKKFNEDNGGNSDTASVIDESMLDSYRIEVVYAFGMEYLLKQHNYQQNTQEQLKLIVKKLMIERLLFLMILDTNVIGWPNFLKRLKVIQQDMFDKFQLVWEPFGKKHNGNFFSSDMSLNTKRTEIIDNEKTDEKECFSVALNQLSNEVASLSKKLTLYQSLMEEDDKGTSCNARKDILSSVENELKILVHRWQIHLSKFEIILQQNINNGLDGKSDQDPFEGMIDTLKNELNEDNYDEKVRPSDNDSSTFLEIPGPENVFECLEISEVEVEKPVKLKLSRDQRIIIQKQKRLKAQRQIEANDKIKFIQELQFKLNERRTN